MKNISCKRKDLYQKSLKRCRKHSDVCSTRSLRRFNDGVIESLASKIKAACDKAIEWCRKRKQENPKLAKIITILLKINGSVASVAGAGLTGFTAGGTIGLIAGRKSLKAAIHDEDFPPVLRALLKSILIMLSGIISLKAANKIEQL